MESTSEKNRIHLSDVAARLLRKQAPELNIVQREKITVKGKGQMQTYWLEVSQLQHNSSQNKLSDEIKEQKYLNDTASQNKPDTFPSSEYLEIDMPPVSQEIKPQENNHPCMKKKKRILVQENQPDACCRSLQRVSKTTNINGNLISDNNVSQDSKEQRHVNFSDVTEERRITMFSEASSTRSSFNGNVEQPVSQDTMPDNKVLNIVSEIMHNPAINRCDYFVENQSASFQNTGIEHPKANGISMMAYLPQNHEKSKQILLDAADV